MSTALLIIDVQQELCFGSEAGFAIESVIANINALSAQARAAGAPVVLIQHEEPGSPLTVGAPGWQLADGLATGETDLKVRKTTGDSFHGTDLQELLQARGIDRVVACGLQTDHCVNATVRGAAALGYDVVLASDGHTTFDDGQGTAAQTIAAHNAELAAVATVVPAAEIRIDA